MAGIIHLVEKTAINSAGTIITVDDNTGVYNVTTNPGGYGAPNDLRSGLYIKLFVTLKKSTGDEQIAVDAYNENTAASWSVTISNDGYYEIYMFSCIAYAGGTTYAANDVVYDTGTDLFYYSKSAANIGNAVTNDTFWGEVTDVSYLKTAVAQAQSDVYADVYEYIELYNSRVTKARAFLQEEECCPTPGCAPSIFEKVRNLIDGATIHEGLLSYSKAQLLVENIEVLNDELISNDQ